MNKEKRIALSGMCISVIGLLFPTIFTDKSIVALNLLVFISCFILVLTRFMEEKNINIKDLDLLLDEKMDKSYNDKKYFEFGLYSAIRPLLLTALTVVAIYLILFLVFL